jgi:hypothetical protein
VIDDLYDSAALIGAACVIDSNGRWISENCDGQGSRGRVRRAPQPARADTYTQADFVAWDRTDARASGAVMRLMLEVRFGR